MTAFQGHWVIYTHEDDAGWATWDITYSKITLDFVPSIIAWCIFSMYLTFVTYKINISQLKYFKNLCTHYTKYSLKRTPHPPHPRSKCTLALGGGGLQLTPKINPHIFIYRPHLHPLHPLATLMNSNESALWISLIYKLPRRLKLVWATDRSFALVGPRVKHAVSFRQLCTHLGVC